MSDLISGNLNEDFKRSDKRKGWFIGYFVDPEDTVKNTFHEHNFEVQWARLTAGQTKKNGPARNREAKTLCILIDGHLKIKFRDSEEKKILRVQGDYVYFPPGVNHYWEAIEDTVTMTIRWPSVHGDQEPLSQQDGG